VHLLVLIQFYFVVYAEGRDVLNPSAENYHVSYDGPNRKHWKYMKCTRRYAAMAVEAMFNRGIEVLDETPILLVSVFINYAS